MNSIKDIVKLLLPQSWFDYYHKIKAERNKNANIFSYIYDHNVWGKSNEETPFNSGCTSTTEFAESYQNFVLEFIKQNAIKKVVDLGCGDFRVSSKIAIPEVNYIGVDVVPSLVAFNQSKYGNNHRSFLVRDIVNEQLPNGDLCLIRQVLQHLSNESIYKILIKLSKYKFILITEHYLPDEQIKQPNLDIPTGQATRANISSAIFLDQPPFNIKNLELVLEIPLLSPYTVVTEGERLKIFLLRNNLDN
jgi:SAM-dependent methyltransferase